MIQENPPKKKTAKIMTKAALIRLTVLFGLVFWGASCMMKMPGKSCQGPFQPLTGKEPALRDLLRRHVQKLGGDIGERNVLAYASLQAAADYVEGVLQESGYSVTRQGFEADGKTCENLETQITGTLMPEEIIVIGAHYDSVFGCPAANDNGSGVAAMLALAHAFAGKDLDKTLRFVAFVNEEPPYFKTAQMGSLVYARRCKERGDNIVAMMSLETIGYYSQEEGSQEYPWPFNYFYPSIGNFIAMIGNTASREFVKKAVGLFRTHCAFPSEGAAMPALLPGIGWSDHWSFWQQGYPALMVTDTAPFRYRHYHTAQDTPDKLDYDRMARVVSGLDKVIAELVGANSRVD